MSDPKISFIMQSYLGSYPGSRANSDQKFLRAVHSFLDQRDARHELVIAADGCDITYNLWKSELKGKPGLKFVYVDKDVPNMYDSPAGGGGKYLRGLPRQVARSIATGDVTTYMDSDDFLMHNATILLRVCWSLYMKNNPGKTIAAFTDAWYDNAARKTGNFKTDIDVNRFTVGDPVKISGLESEWVQMTRIKQPGKIAGLPVTWLMSHTSDLKIKWRDTVCNGLESNSGEDNIFGVAMLKEADVVYNIDYAYYVRCHYREGWDF